MTEAPVTEAQGYHLELSPNSSTELDVMWDEPDEELSHGTIIRYNIGIRKYG